jgi:hypothetical protein
VQAVVFAIIVIAAVASRPIEARLWRGGRLSDRAAAVLLLGRFPVLCFLFGLMAGASLPLLIGITAVGMVPSALFYRRTLGLLRDQKRT